MKLYDLNHQRVKPRLFIKYAYNTFTLNQITKSFYPRILHLSPIIAFFIVLFARPISIATFSKKKKKKEKNFKRPTT